MTSNEGSRYVSSVKSRAGKNKNTNYKILQFDQTSIFWTGFGPDIYNTMTRANLLFEMELIW
jgi:hypothetical protein